jgi:hypothetical protein
VYSAGGAGYCATRVQKSLSDGAGEMDDDELKEKGKAALERFNKALDTGSPIMTFEVDEILKL